VHGLRLPGSRDDGSDYFVWRKLLTVLKRFGSTATNKWVTALSRGYSMEEIRMKKIGSGGGQRACRDQRGCARSG
jgi:hypothetical protein